MAMSSTDRLLYIFQIRQVPSGCGHPIVDCGLILEQTICNLQFLAAVIFDDELLIDTWFSILTARHGHDFPAEVDGVKPQPVRNISAIEVAAVDQILKIGPAAAL